MTKTSAALGLLLALLGCTAPSEPPPLRAAVLTTDDAEIDPRLAPAVLRDGGGITPYTLVSSNEDIRSAAAFLLQISGEDFETDPAAWMAWIASVR